MGALGARAGAPGAGSCEGLWGPCPQWCTTQPPVAGSPRPTHPGKPAPVPPQTGAPPPAWRGLLSPWRRCRVALRGQPGGDVPCSCAVWGLDPSCFLLGVQPGSTGASPTLCLRKLPAGCAPTWGGCWDRLTPGSVVLPASSCRQREPALCPWYRTLHRRQTRSVTPLQPLQSGTATPHPVPLQAHHWTAKCEGPPSAPGTETLGGGGPEPTGASEGPTCQRL